MIVQEHRERLEAMVEDNGQTWDLSDNDKAAIRWAIETLDRPPLPMVMPEREAAIRTDEREAWAGYAARVNNPNPCDPDGPYERGYRRACRDIAAAIRARGEK